MRNFKIEESPINKKQGGGTQESDFNQPTNSSIEHEMEMLLAQGGHPKLTNQVSSQSYSHQYQPNKSPLRDPLAIKKSQSSISNAPVIPPLDFSKLKQT